MKTKRCLFLMILVLALSLTCRAQLFVHKTTFTHADTLRGSLSPSRSCYDINYYHLDVKFDIDPKFISDSNEFRFTATQDFKKLQIDLFTNLNIGKILYHDKVMPYTREAGAVFITFPETIKKGSKDEFTVFYSGYPVVAKKAPMESGVVFAKDSLGDPFVATTCESKGASIWWPNKDHLSDEVDSMLISVSVRNGLQDVSNGRLRKVTNLNNGYTRFDWFVASPINNYNVAVNIARYVHLSDSYQGEKGKLSLDYWVLPYNRVKAERQFKSNVGPMLAAYEHWAGPYPFYQDGYKLVETPYPAMEHQSAISYGGYMKNGPPNELIGVPAGVKWDFVIVHESAHEWFGNNITAKDLADLWIHEAFATYFQSLFVESQYGKPAGQEYLHAMRPDIANDAPIVGRYQVNQLGSGDMYAKGAVLLNTVRTIFNDDEKWRAALRGLNQEFYHQTMSYEQVVNFFSKRAGRNLAPVFEQYLRCKSLPVLEFADKKGQLNCRWICDVAGFRMPVAVKVSGGAYQLIYPSEKFTPVNIKSATRENITADTFNYYIGVLVN